MKKLIKNRIVLLGALLLVVVGSVLVTILVIRNSEQHFTYEEVASWLPNNGHVSPGKKVAVIWQPYQDKTPRLANTSITLTVWLISAQNFNRESCGASPGAILLDTYQTDNTSGQVYQNAVQIPLHQQPGAYDLVAQVTKGGQITSCQWRQIVISPS